MANDKIRSKLLSRRFKNSVHKEGNKLAVFFWKSHGLSYPSSTQDFFKSLIDATNGISRRLALAEKCLENKKNAAEYNRLALDMQLMNKSNRISE